MRLHEDKDAFSELIEKTAEYIGLPQVYIEKDYWVTKSLKQLSQSNYVEDVVFKGGTSLSKAYQLVERFSEDIDLAIFAANKTDAARKKLLKSAEATVSAGLVAVIDDPRISKGSTYRKTVYQYPRHVDGTQFGQASPELLIEVNAFTHPEPCELKSIETIIAQTLPSLNGTELISNFDLESFQIKVLSVKRTLVEKMLGVIKDSYCDDPVAQLSKRIRHLYDICLILQQTENAVFVESDEFLTLCKICIDEESSGNFFSAKCFNNSLADAPLFNQFSDWHERLLTTYNGVFADLVYGERPDIEEIANSLKFLQFHLQRLG
uniref:nucleotidyl transferase AbiEii/AbiGii toxin family protein n=1 Tax=Ningiella ruwaisensis TaxID=2364274 RepID=UPI00109FCD84|nr:nucleotidyl transferase AbiEii/AbiGii toxin family protein [Ningiella ruwaisensis]